MQKLVLWCNDNQFINRGDFFVFTRRCIVQFKRPLSMLHELTCRDSEREYDKRVEKNYHYYSIQMWKASTNCIDVILFMRQFKINGRRPQKTIMHWEKKNNNFSELPFIFALNGTSGTSIDK